MFHRVMAPGAPAAAGADPLFTLSTRFFEQLLVFFRRHYNPVGLESVAKAGRGEGHLPPRALLVTFDDGWADNVDFAAPLLRKAEVPAVFFVTTGAVKSGEAFWQERLFAAAMAAGQGSEAWKSIRPQVDAGASGFARQVRHLIALAEQKGGDAGIKLLDSLPPIDDAARPRMMTPEDVAMLSAEPLFDFGTHGVSHMPFSDLADPEAEFNNSWNDLLAWCEPPTKSFSFPHGKYTADNLAQARAAGYDLAFDSTQTLFPTRSDMNQKVIGRFEVRPPEAMLRIEAGGDAGEKFDPGRIAAEMFLRPIAAERPGRL